MRGTARVEADALLGETDDEVLRRFLDDTRRQLLEILLRPPKQAAVGERDERLVVEARQLREQALPGAHEITLTSQCASRCGVSAAISIPHAASRSAMRLS
jgi:hypothetical protein